ncbi:MAG TPA: ATP synthase F1 subunit epsilon [Candidatus Saccharimonadales bacterium]
MKLQLITLNGSKFDDDIYEITLPTTSGVISVFPGHQPLVTLLKTGVLAVRRRKNDADNELDYFATHGGVAEINGQQVRVLVDEADRSEDIAEAEAQKALERAKALRASAKDQLEIDKAQAMIDRYATRIKVAGLRRRHRER